MDKITTIARCKFPSIILLAMIVLSVCFLSGQQAIAQTDLATSKLLSANTAVSQAFNAVLDAEKAGANITDLLSRLDYANSILANAENSYSAGDFSKAVLQVDSLLPIVQQVAFAAQSAKQAALVSSQTAFWSSITLTVIGVFVFVLVLFLVWRLFKLNYIKRLSQTKPEVVNDEIS